MRTKLLSMMAGYKYLISKSKTYPLLNFKDISQWVVNDLGLLDKINLTKSVFEGCYLACKQFSFSWIDV